MKRLAAKLKRSSALDRYIIFCFAVMIIFTVAELVLASATGQNHDTLTTCLFGCFGGELVLCAVIKRFKLKRGDGDSGTDEGGDAG